MSRSRGSDGSTGPRSRSDEVLFITSAGTAKEMAAATLLIESIRSFGGRFGSCPVWLFDFRPSGAADLAPPELGIRLVPARVPAAVNGYELAEKVFACAEAERLAEPGVRSLVWLSPDSLMVGPPVLYDLGEDYHAAVRPVHVKNVGLPVDESADGYWARIIEATGAADSEYSVESFVDGRRIRAYFNSHSYCVSPSVGLFSRWYERFEDLVLDDEFQSSACSDELYRIFLHQAVLSALTVAMIDSDRIRILPPTYSYPYNLQGSIPSDKRVTTMTELVSIVYEDLSIHPEDIEDMEVSEPLRSWLSARISRT